MLSTRALRADRVRRPILTWTLTRPEQPGSSWEARARRLTPLNTTVPVVRQRSLDPSEQVLLPVIVEGTRGGNAVVVDVVVDVVVTTITPPVVDPWPVVPDVVVVVLEPVPVPVPVPLVLVPLVLVPEVEVPLVPVVLDDEVVVPLVPAPVVEVPVVPLGLPRPTMPIGLQSASRPPLPSKSKTEQSNTVPPTAPASCAPVYWTITSVPLTAGVEPETGNERFPLLSTSAKLNDDG